MLSESAESRFVILLSFSHFSQKPVFFRSKSAKPDAVLYSRLFEHLSSIKLAENGRKFADKTAWYRLYFQRLHNAAQNSKSCFHFGSPNCRKASNHAGLRASSNRELGSVLSCCSSQFPRLEFCGKMAIMRAAIWQPLWEVCFGVP